MAGELGGEPSNPAGLKPLFFPTALPARPDPPLLPPAPWTVHTHNKTQSVISEENGPRWLVNSTDPGPILSKRGGGWRWGVPLGDGLKNSRLDQLLRLEPLSKDPTSLRLFFQNAKMRWGPRATVPSSVRLLHFPCILLPCPHCEPTSSPFCEKQLLSKELQAVSCFWKRSYVTDRGVV